MNRKETSMNSVREETKLLLHAAPVECDNSFGIVQHPFTTSTVAFLRNKEAVDLLTEDGYKKWIKDMETVIDKMSLDQIFHILLCDAWYLTWLKFVKPHLSKDDFTKYLAAAWTGEENPNMDANVTIPELIRWFKSADKKVLMDEEEYDYWASLPEEVVLYRGVSRGRKKYGLSWTDEVKVAEWFKNRFNNQEDQGQLLKVVVSKKHCLCYFNGRNEKEIVLDVNSVKSDIIEVEV